MSADPIEDAWARLEAEWADEEAHRKFIGLCATMNRLADAGRRYREVKDTDPRRREMAEQQIDRLLAHAMQSLEANRTEPPKHARALLFFIAAAITLGMIAAVIWLVST